MTVVYVKRASKHALSINTNQSLIVFRVVLLPVRHSPLLPARNTIDCDTGLTQHSQAIVAIIGASRHHR